MSRGNRIGRYVVAMALAFGIGAAVAVSGRGAERDGTYLPPRSPEAQPPLASPAGATTVSADDTAQAEDPEAAPLPAVEAPGHRMLQPVRWSQDLAAGYRLAEERDQLVLLFATPGAET